MNVKVKEQMENFIKGACMTKCPVQEIKMREEARLLHRLEMVSGTEKDTFPKADPQKSIKCFSRSAADMNMAVPHLIRPFDILLQTVNYLTNEVIQNKEVSTLSVYNFVLDRLRAVRQDMTIQALPPEQSIPLLEPMVLFHTLYGYKLCELPPGDYDAVLNKQHLLECLKKLLVCYNAIKEANQPPQVENYMMNRKQSENNCERSKSVSRYRLLVESLYILCNLNDRHPLDRYLKLPKQYRIGSVKLSYQIAVEIMHGNSVHACRLATRLCPVAFCAFSMHLPYIQRRTLEVFSHAYNHTQLTFPSAVLSQHILFNSSEDVRRVCAHYGLRCPDGDVLFRKTDFKGDARLPQPKKLWFMEEPTSLFPIDFRPLRA